MLTNTDLVRSAAFHVDHVVVAWDLPDLVATVDAVHFSEEEGWSSEVVELVDGPGGRMTVRHTGGPDTGGASHSYATSPPATTITFTVGEATGSRRLAWPALTTLETRAYTVVGDVTETCTPDDPTPIFAGTTVVGGDPFTDVPLDHPFLAPIAALSAAGVAEGQADGAFRPLGPVTRQALAAFAHRLAGEPAFEVPGEPTFPDVPLDHPFRTAIEWLAATGASTGFPDGTFRPLEPLSRQHLAAFLHRLAGAPQGSIPGWYLFDDVPEESPFSVAVGWLAMEGVVGGYPDRTFRPRDTATRQAMMAFLQRFADGRPGRSDTAGYWGYGQPSG